MKRKVVTVMNDGGLALLRTKSVAVPFTVLGDGTLCLDHETLELIQDLKAFVLECNGLGMSAIQLGVAKRIFVMRKANQLVTIINPRNIDEATLGTSQLESCFSVPLPQGTGVFVRRAVHLYATYDTELGTCVERERFTSLDARIFLHELDHLDGKLTISEDRFENWGTF